MSDLGAQVRLLASSVAKLLRDLRDLTARVVRLEQRVWTAAGGAGGSGGTSAATYVCYPTASVAGATWSGGVPTAGVSFGATVCKVSSSGVTNLGSQTCYNWLAASLAANKGCIVVPDGTGDYTVVSQSCS